MSKVNTRQDTHACKIFEVQHIYKDYIADISLKVIVAYHDLFIHDDPLLYI